MHFRPLHDHVLVSRIDAEKKTAGGIIIPEAAKEKPQEGEIIAAGRQDLPIMKESDLLGIVEHSGNSKKAA